MLVGKERAATGGSGEQAAAAPSSLYSANLTASIEQFGEPFVNPRLKD